MLQSYLLYVAPILFQIIYMIDYASSITIYNNVIRSESCLVCSTGELMIKEESSCESVKYLNQFYLDTIFIMSKLYVRCFINNEDDPNNEIEKSIKKKIVVKDGTFEINMDKEIYYLEDYAINEINVAAGLNPIDNVETLRILHPKIEL